MRELRPLFASLCLSACVFMFGAAPASAQSAAAQPAVTQNGDGAAGETRGIASWYGADFHGKATSSGEVYDKEKLTCAHRSYPFGTYLRVRNLDNGSSVVVRVNDRGPFAKNRIIDLSEAAARLIGMIPTGTARVSLSVIPPEEALAWKGAPLDGSEAVPSSPKAGASSPGTKQPAPGVEEGAAHTYVRIQVASYASRANADSTVERLAASGLRAGIEEASGRYRVVFPRLSPEEARLVSLRLDGLGYRGYIVTTIRPE